MLAGGTAQAPLAGRSPRHGPRRAMGKAPCQRVDGGTACSSRARSRRAPGAVGHLAHLLGGRPRPARRSRSSPGAERRGPRATEAPVDRGARADRCARRRPIPPLRRPRPAPPGRLARRRTPAPPYPVGPSLGPRDQWPNRAPTGRPARSQWVTRRPNGASVRRRLGRGHGKRAGRRAQGAWLRTLAPDVPPILVEGPSRRLRRRPGSPARNARLDAPRRTAGRPRPRRSAHPSGADPRHAARRRRGAATRGARSASRSAGHRVPSPCGRRPRDEHQREHEQEEDAHRHRSARSRPRFRRSRLKKR